MKKKLLIFGIAGLVLIASLILIIALVQGPNSPVTMGTANAPGGAINWAAVDNAKASDNAYATAAVQVYGEDTSVVEHSIKIVKGGTILGNEKSTGATLPVPEAYRTYGGATDLWGTTWTPADINSVNFGVVFSVEGYPFSGLASHYLKATNFGFSIPVGATINGIKVEIESTWAEVVGHNGVGKVDHIRITVYVTADTCTCPGLNQYWEINMADHCVISTACDLGNGKLAFTGTGYATCDAAIVTTDLGDPGAGAILYIDDNCVITVN